jgi:SAM-dependent methyltransferase
VSLRDRLAMRIRARRWLRDARVARVWLALEARAGARDRAGRTARQDAVLHAAPGSRVFSAGTRPVLRWIKGDGLDDDVTRAALLAATSLFGDRVDYCLCTRDIEPARARDLMAWATRPVEWWPVSPADNPELAAGLQLADCPPDRFGYWWKWFPERVRPDGPEWILDGDMVVVAEPDWFAVWAAGRDPARISVDDISSRKRMYGRFAPMVDPAHGMYSGLVSVPPGFRYLPVMAHLLQEHPLDAPHDGRSDMEEQGVIAAAFERLGARPVPLHEFPFARAYEDQVDYGKRGDQGRTWGYHFSYSFRRTNELFDRLTADGTVPSRSSAPTVVERFTWLGNDGEWGIPGSSLNPVCTQFVLDAAAPFAGRPLLELGTSRGRIAAMLDQIGLRVTTIDHVDRGAAQNLMDTSVEVVVDDALEFLAATGRRFDVVLVDLHGNSPEQWRELLPLLCRVLAPGGRMIWDNAVLARQAAWREESGVAWAVEHLPDHLRVTSSIDVDPGVVVIDHA